ncbi:MULTISPECIES: hypothetical protein [Chromobacterium]|uniref:Uncharacterized protein n=1 Tax=Chromobacterium phragmitis TaxID=2202141 RepID=A0ABV0J0X8_9NEIS|nr:hypothetical protein [Chromobacterium sp. ASV23]
MPAPTMVYLAIAFTVQVGPGGKELVTPQRIFEGSKETCQEVAMFVKKNTKEIVEAGDDKKRSSGLIDIRCIPAGYL